LNCQELENTIANEQEAGGLSAKHCNTKLNYIYTKKQEENTKGIKRLTIDTKDVKLELAVRPIRRVNHWA